jgi:hypothetical protein
MYTVRVSVHQSKLLGKLLLAFAILTAAACSAPPQPDVNPPSGAVPLTGGLAIDTTINLAEVDFLLRMPDSMRHAHETQRWKVPRNLSWGQLRDHYAAQLGGGWSIDKHFSEQGSTYRRTVWRYDGGIRWWDRRPFFAIAYVDLPAGYDFAVLSTIRPDVER